MDHPEESKVARRELRRLREELESMKRELEELKDDLEVKIRETLEEDR